MLFTRSAESAAKAREDFKKLLKNYKISVKEKVLPLCTVLIVKVKHFTFAVRFKEETLGGDIEVWDAKHPEKDGYDFTTDMDALKAIIMIKDYEGGN